MKKTITILLLTAILLSIAAPAAFAAEAVPEMPVIDFEDGGLHGVEARGRDEKLTVTGEQSHSGGKSLLVTGRTQKWHGASVRVEPYLIPDITYEITAWVRSNTSSASTFRLSTQIGTDEEVAYRGIDVKEIAVADGWTKLMGRFSYFKSEYVLDDYVTIYVENDTPDAEYYIDDISFIQLEKTEYGKSLLAAARLPSLEEIYQDEFLLGSIFDSSIVSNKLYYSVLGKHFNVLTASYQMKSDQMAKEKGIYTFTVADEMLETIFETGFAVHGHALLWHEQHAAWLTNHSDGSPLKRAEALKNMTDFINQVVGHYAGQLTSWDVLNEAMRDGAGDVGWREALRFDEPWYVAFANGAGQNESGADYIETAFRLARQADPYAKLYYNDYGLNNQDKAAAVADMVKEINDKYLAEGHDRLLIEGIGMQGHYNIYVDPEDVERSIQRFIGLGVEISVSELDISISGLSEDGQATPGMLKKQAELYAKLFQLFTKYSDSIQRVTFWGLCDTTSWISQNKPMLFDEDFAPKLAYFAVADPEGYLAGNFDTAEKREAWIREHNSPDPADIPSTWAAAQVSAAIEAKLVPQSLQGKYAADITRAEFCALAVAVFEAHTGQAITESKTFPDDGGDSNIRKMAGLGVVGGGNDGQFHPDITFNREMAAALLVNLLKAMEIDLARNPTTFPDSTTSWAAEQIGQVQAAGLIRGSGGNFNPKGKFTRESGILLMLKLWDYLNA